MENVLVPFPETPGERWTPIADPRLADAVRRHVEATGSDPRHLHPELGRDPEMLELFLILSGFQGEG